jgi:biotin operon repressor
MEGWIKLHRKIKSWEWYNDANTFRLFVHILLGANSKPSKWKGISIGRGEILTGRKALADELKISEQAIRTSLQHLKTTGEIIISTTNKYSLITICNYEDYQLIQTDNQPAINQQSTSNQPANQPIINQQKTLISGYDTSCYFLVRPVNNQQLTGKDFSYSPKFNHKQEERRQEYNKDTGGEAPIDFLKTEKDGSTVTTKRVDLTPYKKIVDLYHSICKSYPVLQKITDDRKIKIHLRFAEMKTDINTVSSLFTKMENSKFLQGDNPRAWKATFDWVFSNSKNWVKVVEGNYDNTETPKQPTAAPRKPAVVHAKPALTEQEIEQIYKDGLKKAWEMCKTGYNSVFPLTGSYTFLKKRGFISDDQIEGVASEAEKKVQARMKNKNRGVMASLITNESLGEQIRAEAQTILVEQFLKTVNEDQLTKIIET